MGAEQETVQLCYALHDDSGHFAKFLGTSLLSVLAHARARRVPAVAPVVVRQGRGT